MHGVFSTRSVWAGPKEVVHVTYDPDLVDYKDLLAGAERMECTSAVYTFDDEQKELARKAGLKEVISWKESLETRQVKKAEQKYYLRNSELAILPLTELQAVKLNVALSPFRGEADVISSHLSPRQIALFERIQTAIAKDEQAFDGFSFPEDQSNLIKYNRKLLAKLEELEK